MTFSGRSSLLFFALISAGCILPSFVFAESAATTTPTSTPAAAAPRKATAPVSATPPSTDTSDDDDGTVDPQQIYDAGKALFDAYAPEDVKRDYEFPSREDWDAFVARVQQALEGGSMEELAALEPDVRRALVALRLTPQYADYVDWLSERLDLIETARDAVAARHRPRLLAPTEVPAPSPKPNEPAPPPTTAQQPSPHPTETPSADPNIALPYYNTWLARLRDRPKPAQASDLMPLLKTIFSAEGIPPELAWLAEVESSLNPQARSPAGARGLFQLMPATAKSMGLSLFPFDERVQPGKNARAAAKMLHRLHERFDDWPLALAAYNVGEGKLAALLKKDQANSFASIANDLPVETRMYVPKVFATLTIRENVAPASLQNPAHRIDGHTDVTPETATPPQKSPLADVAVD